MTYTVITTIQTTRESAGVPLANPCDVQYYKGDNLAVALTAMAQAATAYEDDPAWVKTLSVRLDFS